MPDDDLLSHGEAPHYHRRYRWFQCSMFVRQFGMGR